MRKTTKQWVESPTDREMRAILWRRKMFDPETGAPRNYEITRQWEIAARNAKSMREGFDPHHVAVEDSKVNAEGKNLDKFGDTGGPKGRAFMNLPPVLDQRIESRFGTKWLYDKKARKFVWDNYPEFRAREKYQ